MCVAKFPEQSLLSCVPCVVQVLAKEAAVFCTGELDCKLMSVVEVINNVLDRRSLEAENISFAVGTVDLGHDAADEW